MARYLYDGSFPGLMTVLQKTFEIKEAPDNITIESSLQLDLFTPVIEIGTDEAAARSFVREMGARISREAVHNVMYAFLSEEDGMEMCIRAYLEKGWSLGASLDRHLHNPSVHDLHRMVQRLCVECHRMKGFVRFQQLEDGLLYAPLEPDHNILALIAPHFARRFKGLKWSIHDRKRGLAAIHDGSSWSIVSITAEEEPALDAQERHWQELWKAYGCHISIETRRNPVLQRRLMPRRYWKYLPEVTPFPVRFRASKSPAEALQENRS
jgi:probable DNA metabolism protein